MATTETNPDSVHASAASLGDPQIKPDYDERLTNEDLAPLGKQTWNSYNIFAFWMSDVHSVGGYVTAGSLFALGLTSWQVFDLGGRRQAGLNDADRRWPVLLLRRAASVRTAERQGDLPGSLREYFAGWAEPVQLLIDRLDPQSTNRVEVADIEPFMTWTKGWVALLGDAGHSTTPDIGQGGCRAMEDAVVLAMALQTNTLGVEDALRRYQDRRNGRTGELVLRARKRCDVTHGKNWDATKAWYDELRHEDGTNVFRGIVASIVGNPVS